MDDKERNTIIDFATSLKDSMRGVTYANSLIWDGAERSTLNPLEKAGLTKLARKVKEDSDQAYGDLQGILNVLEGIFPDKSKETL